MLLYLISCSEPAPRIQTAEKLLVPMEEVASSPEHLERQLYSQIEARQDAVLSSAVGGRVVQLSARPGEQVVAGQILLQLDSRIAQAQLDIAEAGLQERRALLQEAQRQVERVQALGDSAAEAERESVLSVQARAEAGVLAGEAQLRLAQAQLEQHLLRAPFAGELVSLETELGVTLAPGLGVARVVDASRLEVPLALHESEALLAREDAAGFLVTGKDGSSHEAELLELSLARDPRTQAWPARLQLAAQSELLVGSPVEVALRLPAPAVEGFISFSSLDGDQVWVVEEGRLRAVPVDVIWENEEGLGVNGVRAGQQVVRRISPEFQADLEVRILEEAP